MTGKHRDWPKAWHFDGARLAHDDVPGWCSTDDTTQAWSAYELAREWQLRNP